MNATSSSRLLKNGRMRRKPLFWRCSGSASTGVSGYAWRLKVFSGWT
jgi:hypothetical protein